MAHNCNAPNCPHEPTKLSLRAQVLPHPLFSAHELAGGTGLAPAFQASHTGVTASTKQAPSETQA